MLQGFLSSGGGGGGVLHLRLYLSVQLTVAVKKRCEDSDQGLLVSVCQVVVPDDPADSASQQHL